MAVRPLFSRFQAILRIFLIIILEVYSNPNIKVTGSVSVCLYPRISLTDDELNRVRLPVKLLIGRGQVFNHFGEIVTRKIYPFLKNIFLSFDRRFVPLIPPPFLQVHYMPLQAQLATRFIYKDIKKFGGQDDNEKVIHLPFYIFQPFLPLHCYIWHWVTKNLH